LRRGFRKLDSLLLEVSSELSSIPGCEISCGEGREEKEVSSKRKGEEKGDEEEERTLVFVEPRSGSLRREKESSASDGGKRETHL